MDIELNKEVMGNLKTIANNKNISVNELISNIIDGYISNNEYDEIIICNDFSLHMLTENTSLKIEKIPYEKLCGILQSDKYNSKIGDEKIAKLFGLEYSPSKIQLTENNVLIVIKANGNNSHNTLIEDDFEFWEIKYC